MRILILIILLCYPLLHFGQAKCQHIPDNQLTTKQLQFKNNNLQLKTVKSNEVIVIPKGFFDGNSVSFQLAPDNSIFLLQQDIGYSGVLLPYWTGRAGGNTYEGAFIINGRRISGHMKGRYFNYEIYPIDDNGAHLLAELNDDFEATCLQDNPIDKQRQIDYEKQYDAPQAPPKAKHNTNGTECYIRLLVPFTTAAKQATANNLGRRMIEHISLVVVELNQSYANSHVNQRVELALAYETSDAETGDIEHDRLALRNNNDDHWDEVHGLRTAYRADMVGLITDRVYGSIAGAVYDFDYTSYSNMYMLAEYQRAVSAYTFGHEFGHQQGCRHNNDGTQTPHMHARGRAESGVYLTMMASHGSVAKGTSRIHYWANPNQLNPVTSGTTGTSTRNTVAALNVSANVVAHHTETPETFFEARHIPRDEGVNMVTTIETQSINVVEPGGQLELKSLRQVRLRRGFHAKAESRMRAHIIEPCDDDLTSVNTQIRNTSTINETVDSSLSFTVQPNPISNNGQIQYTLDKPQNVSIYLSDLYGRQVEILQTQQLLEAGNHILHFNAHHLQNTVYQLIIKHNSVQKVLPIVVLK